MSHFTTLVIIERGMQYEPETIPKELAKRLAPFQENNMDDCPKEYLEFNDEEDKYLKEYEGGKGREMVVMPDGRLLLPWDDEFKREPTEEELKDDPVAKLTKVTSPPENLARRVVPFKETYATFEEFVKEWHGRDARDETYNRYGYWENPNAKWDWYEVGGRWAGFFKLKKGHTGGLGKQYNYGAIKESQNRADIAFKKGIDFEFMRKEFEDSAAIRYDLVHEAIKGMPEAESWEVIRSGFNLDTPGEIEKARAKYHAQPRVKAFRKLTMSEKGIDLFGFFSGVEDYQIPRERYLANARNNAGVPHALIKDGKWYEQGEMGWWGVVRNEKDPETWSAMVAQLMDELPDDTLLIAVDCHI
jgi:hypothetical protein